MVFRIMNKQNRIVRNEKILLKFEFVVSELVIGSSEQDILL